jgi:molybdopterin molybdotransferase
MLTVEQALEQVLKHAQRRAPEMAALTPALLGLVLAEEVASDLDQPPFDKSLVDGYALRSEDVAMPSGRPPQTGGLAATSPLLKVVEEIVAGRPPRQLIRSGEAARIMTGAMVPGGADAVVMQEHTQDIGEGRVCILQTSVKAGSNILPRGREMRAGERVLSAGAVLRPQELGLLASVGRNMVQVYPRPVVAVLSTGDELVEPGTQPGAGQIRNSNAPLLSAQITRAGADAAYLGIARDSVESLRIFIAEGLRCDVLVLTGGVSAGKLDLVPWALQEIGVSPVFHKVAMKPGKPLFFGVQGEKLIFGLPGNPVSTLVGFELFVRPALEALLGRTPGRRFVQASLTSEFRYASDRPTYHPAVLTAAPHGWQVTLVPWFGSPDLRAITNANAFARLEVGERHYQPGDLLSVMAVEM